MSIEARLKKIEEKLEYTGYDQNHPHVAKAHQVKGKLYNDDGTEFISNHPKDCPQLFIIRTRGEEYHEVPV